jgi:hypothetical protein
MSNCGEKIVIIFGLILTLATFFFPFIISIITGNWWYCFLFLVSWIPTVFEMIILKAILD